MRLWRKSYQRGSLAAGPLDAIAIHNLTKGDSI
jgi:hypothetical protein